MSNGITYFPLDVHMDDNIELIEAEFGLTGFAVIVKLYQKIYGDLVITVNGQTTWLCCSPGVWVALLCPK